MSLKTILKHDARVHVLPVFYGSVVFLGRLPGGPDSSHSTGSSASASSPPTSQRAEKT